MPKYSFNSKSSKESISVVEAVNKSAAIEFFAKLKVLPLTKFLDLYEVVERVH